VSKKWSSFKEQQLITENFKKWLEEEEGVPQEEEGVPQAQEEESASLQDAAQWLADEIVPLIQAADAGDFIEPLGLLVNKLNTPKGMSPAVRALLFKGGDDGDSKDEAIKVTTAPIPAPNLIPTQGVIDLFKSVGFNGSKADSLKAVIGGVSGAPPILAAGSGGTYYIIDGHHRWSGATVFNVDCKIPANIIQMPPNRALLVSQLAIAAYVGTKKIPSATAKAGRSIIGPDAMSSEAVYKILKESVGKVIDKKAGAPFWNPEVMNVVVEAGYGKKYLQQGQTKALDRGRAQPEQEPEEQEQEQSLQEFNQMQLALASSGLKQVAANCGILAAKHSKEGPPREIMPQFDPSKGGPDFKDIASKFSGGDINYEPSFMPQAAEGLARKTDTTDKKWSSFEGQQRLTENFRKWVNEDLTPHWGDKEKSHWSSSSETKPEDAPEPEPAAEPEPEPEATPQRETPGYKDDIPCARLLHRSQYLRKLADEPNRRYQDRMLENPPDDGYYYDTGKIIWSKHNGPPGLQDTHAANKDYQRCMDKGDHWPKKEPVFKKSALQYATDQMRVKEGHVEESDSSGNIEKSKE
jgi:hypothetical protein